MTADQQITLRLAIGEPVPRVAYSLQDKKGAAAESRLMRPTAMPLLFYQWILGLDLLTTNLIVQRAGSLTRGDDRRWQFPPRSGHDPARKGLGC